ncbi:MAG TPA: neutral/alkaline non-lysosomal ceramidase N-terminal domain-containing protein, partial [Polyangiales bacterium]|nr:neutral/alkaline non-lysosomal ceramidase N-terminal domain-containing protein [Polyangiales bacterium]
MIARRLALVLVSLAALAGCTHWKPLPNPSTAALGFAGSDVQAGIFEVDITPPSYLGMFGHGPESRVSVGTQLRLRCQAFVIIGARPEPGKPAEAVALVPCDLSSPSLLLQREVARRVAEQGTPIGAERILLMATHTHMAPAHYFPAGNYNGPFSSRLTGFDPRVVEFLSTRIAHAIVEAYTHAQWAQLAWSQGPMSQRITRNRNPLPLMRDRDVPDWLLKRIAADPLHPEEGAVDPTLSVLRIERYDAKAKKYVPYGAFATVGMHPTAVPNTCDMYNSDVFGYATRYVEEKLGADAPGFVVGIANGIEGDVMPARNSAGQREARRIGHRLADEIIARHALATTLDRHAAVRVAYRELTLPNA